MSSGSSLKSRFAFKLTSNVGSALLGVAAMAVVPRALGPADYGRFEFLTANFKLILDSLTLHAPTAFFNWISRKAHKEDSDVPVAVTFTAVSASMVLFGGAIAAAVLSDLNASLWPDVAPAYLGEAFALTCALFLFQMCSVLADGLALTAVLEQLRIAQNVAKTALILVLVWAGMLTLHTYFLSQVLVAAVASAATLQWLYRKKAFSLRVLRPWRLPRPEVLQYLSFLGEYARPLVLLLAVGFLFNYFDRWFLQYIGGASQYGYFGLSDRLGAVAILFTTAMTPLLTREFAYAFEEKDRGRLAGLFDRIKIFLFLAALVSCFLSVHSAPLVDLIGGESFRGAVIPISIMSLYPIHQTFGQLSSALMIAMGQTGLYASIGIVGTVAGLPLTYFLLAPPAYTFPGLGSGAVGLAAKMVLMNIIGTNVQLYFNTRYLGISFLEWLFLQVKIVGTLFLAAGGAFLAVRSLPADLVLRLNILRVDPSLFVPFARILCSGLLYLAAVGFLVALSPELAGLSREEFRRLFREVRSKLRREKREEHE